MILHGTTDFNFKVNFTVGLEVITLAHKYEVKFVVNLIAERLANNVNVDNVVNVLSIGNKLNLNVLKEAATKFIATKPVANLEDLPNFKPMTVDMYNSVIKAFYSKL